jgi:hypothetical protein
MTIGVGFLCGDGAVLGTDTEESYQDTKTSVNKITIVKRTYIHAGVAASGESGLIDYIVPKVCRYLESEKGDNTTIEAGLQSLMADVYDSKQVRSYPSDKPEDKTVSMIVICRPKGHIAAMFQTCASLVTRVVTPALIGCGPLRDIADEFGRFSMTTDKARWAALYLVLLAKERWNGVGGLSQVLQIWNDGSYALDRHWDQARRERLLLSIRSMHHLAVLNTTDLVQSDREFTKNSSAILRHLREIRKELRGIDEQNMQQIFRTQLGIKTDKATIRHLAKQAKYTGRLRS